MIKKIANKKNLIKLTGLVFFVLIIILKIDFKKIYQLITNLNLFSLILICLFTLLPLLIKVFRWHYILKKLGIIRSFRKIYKIYYLSMIPGNITPGYLGGMATQIVYLKNKDHKTSSSLTSIIIDRLSDIVILLIISIAGLIVFLPLLKIKGLIIAIILLLLIVFLFLSIKIKFFRKILVKIFFLITPKKIQNLSKDYLKNILAGLEKITFQDILIILGLTILNYFLVWFYLYLLAQVIGIAQVPPLFLLLIFAITRFIIIIPITIAGLGTREISVLALLSVFSISNEIALIYSLLMSFLVLIPIFLIGSYFWLKEPLPSFKPR